MTSSTVLTCPLLIQATPHRQHFTKQSFPIQVVVFSWTRCPFCKNAKALLDSKGAKYTAVELDTMTEGNAIRAQLAEVRCGCKCLRVSMH